MSAVRRAGWIAGLAAFAVSVTAPAAWATGAAHWVEAWYAPPFPTTAVWGCNQQRTFTHQSVRQTVQLEAGGNRVRIRLTNELGLSPVRFVEIRSHRWCRRIRVARRSHVVITSCFMNRCD